MADKKYSILKQFHLPTLEASILNDWKVENTFEKSVANRNGKPAFVFYEGPRCV